MTIISESPDKILLILLISDVCEPGSSLNHSWRNHRRNRRCEILARIDRRSSGHTIALLDAGLSEGFGENSVLKVRSLLVFTTDAIDFRSNVFAHGIKRFIAVCGTFDIGIDVEVDAVLEFQIFCFFILGFDVQQ